MRLYKRNGSPKWWAAWTDQKGRRHRKSTGTEDQDLARALAAKWQQESFLEHHFGAIPEFPFREALFRYGQERQRENPQSYGESARYRLQKLLDRFDGLNVREITTAMIRDFADERLETVKPATAYRELTVLKAILNKAHREERLAVMPRFPKLKAQKGRCRWLTVEEEQRLLRLLRST